MLDQERYQVTVNSPSAGLHKTIEVAPGQAEQYRVVEKYRQTKLQPGGKLTRNSPQSQALTAAKSSYQALPIINRSNDPNSGVISGTHNFNSLMIESDIQSSAHGSLAGVNQIFTPHSQNPNPLNAHLSRNLRQGRQSHMDQKQMPSIGLSRANQQSSQFIVDSGGVKQSRYDSINQSNLQGHFSLKKDPSIQRIDTLTDDQVTDLKSHLGLQERGHEGIYSQEASVSRGYSRNNKTALRTPTDSSFILLPQIAQTIVEEQNLSHFKGNILSAKNRDSAFLRQFKVHGGFTRTRDPNAQSKATLTENLSRATLNASHMRNAGGAKSGLSSYGDRAASVLDQRILQAIGGSGHQHTFSGAPHVEGSTLMQTNSKQNLWNVQSQQAGGHFQKRSKSLAMNTKYLQKRNGHSSPMQNMLVAADSENSQVAPQHHRNLDQILEQVKNIQEEVNQSLRTQKALDKAAGEAYDFNKDFKLDNDKSLLERAEGQRFEAVAVENKNSRTCKKDFDKEMRELLGLEKEETAEERQERLMFDQDFNATYHQNVGDAMGDVIAVSYGKEALTANQKELERFRRKPISQKIKDQAQVRELWQFEKAIKVQRQLKLDSNKDIFNKIRDLNLNQHEIMELQLRGFGDLLQIIEQDEELHNMAQDLEQKPGGSEMGKSGASMLQNPMEQYENVKQMQIGQSAAKLQEAVHASRQARTLKPTTNKKMIQAIQKSKHSGSRQDDTQSNTQNSYATQQSMRRLDSGTIPELSDSGSASPSPLARKKSLQRQKTKRKDSAQNLAGSPTPKKRSKRLARQSEISNAFIWERELRKSKNFEDYAPGTEDHARLKANISYTVRRRAKLTYDQRKRTQHEEFTRVFQELSSKKKKAAPTAEDEEEKDDDEEGKKQVTQHETVESMLDAKFRAVNKKNQELHAEKMKREFIRKFSEDQRVISLIMMQDSMRKEELKHYASKWGRVSKKVAKVSDNRPDGQHAVRDLVDMLQGGTDQVVDAGLRSMIKIQKTGGKDMSDAFDRYVQKEDDLMAEIGETLSTKLADWKLFREAHTPSVQERNEVAPKFQYFLQCNIDHELVLPVLDYVYKKTLCLQSYTLSIGHCNALAQAFQHFDQFINRVIFDNCGIDDGEFAAILGAVKKLRDFKKIIYRRNCFHEESLAEIQELFERKIPNHLEELRIENCQIKDNVTEQLVDMLYERNYLKKISLVHAHLNDNAMATFCEFVDDSVHLEEIDLSYNQLLPRGFSRFLEVISTNSQIQYLNLSWNTLFEEHPFAEKKKKRARKQDLFIVEDLDREKDHLDEFDEELTEAATTAIEFLCKFIKRSRVLVHADLSNTGLNEKALWYFGRAMRRSKSLRSLHLSGNPGITDRLIGYLTERAHCIPEEPNNELDFSQMPSQLELKNLEKEHQGLNLKIQRNRLKDKYQAKFKEVQQIKSIMFQKRVESSAILQLDPQKERYNEDENKEVKNLTKILTFTRKLAHKEDMPGSAQWKIITKEPPGTNACWVCDRQIYSIVFWNELIGAHQMSSFSAKDKQYILKKIKSINSLEDDKSLGPGQSQGQGFTMDAEFLNTTCPRICGAFTNWKEKRMFDIREFCDRINLGKPDIFQLCKDQGIISSAARSLEELSSAELEAYQREVRFYFETYRTTWKDVLQTYMKYEKPNLVHANNKTSLQNKDYPLYVFPCFMRAGKHFYCVKYNLKGQVQLRNESKNPSQAGGTQSSFFGQSQYSQFGKTGQKAAMNDSQQTPTAAAAKVQAFPSTLYLGQFVANFRNEPIPKYVKSFKHNVVKRQFRKDISVFASWKQDDGGTVRKCMDHDTRYWKCPRFIKDQTELRKLTDCVKRNFMVLKNSFLHLASYSTWPSIGINDFTTFVRRANFLEAQLPQSTVDRYFLQVNVEVEDQGDNPDKALIRFEYIELMIRLAIEKYKRLGSAKNSVEALEMLIETNLKPYSGYLEWQGFRETQLWTLDVNDLLQANLEKLKKVYGHFTSPTVKRMSLDHILELFMEKNDLQMTVKDVTFCYGMSKMTYADENNDGEARMKRIDFVELLEMIGRAADVKFRGSELEDLPLYRKIEFILSDIFQYFGMQASPISVDIEEETASDSDY